MQKAFCAFVLVEGSLLPGVERPWSHRLVLQFIFDSNESLIIEIDPECSSFLQHEDY